MDFGLVSHEYDDVGQAGWVTRWGRGVYLSRFLCLIVLGHRQRNIWLLKVILG
jgi:hypothetical protein